ncbi:MAG TPA: TonB-dependent receptor [Novosphingobium sp.]|nr:TonB-dependent receptor [Novosphingobium sp.]
MKSLFAGAAGFRRAALFGSAAMIALATPGVALAQVAEEEAQPATDPPAEDQTADEGNEIIVTATKRERTLQDVPVAVSVTTAEQIERAQIRDIKDLQSLVPSLRVSTSQSAFATTYSIRGFGTSGNNIGLEPSVAVFVDGVYRSRAIAQIGDLPDIQRVEVLRGPQSTLFGKNASAGVISIVSKKPSFQFGGSVEASYGNYDAVVIKGVVTGPITDGIAASLAAGYNRRDGYVTNLANSDDLANRNRWFVRGQMLFEPSDALTIRLTGDYDELDENCCAVLNLRRSAASGAVLAVGGQLNNPATPFADEVYSDVVPFSKVRNWGISGQLDYELGPLTLTSITAWRDTRLDANQDVDFSSARLATGANIGQSDLKTFTQELRLATNLDGPFNALIGGYYFNETAKGSDRIVYGADFRNYVDLLIRGLTGNALNAGTLEASLGAPPNTFWQAGQGFFNRFTQKDESYSIFGNVDFEVSDRLTVTLGANYTHDAKDVTGTSVSTDRFSAVVLPAPLAGFKALQFLPPFLNIPNAVESGKTRDSDWSWTARLAYEVSDTLNTYVSYSTGFKASSFNLSRDSRPTPADLATIVSRGLGVPNLVSGTRFAEPEDSSVYELGIKGNWGIASANLTFFKQTIRNFQANTFTGTGYILGNADKQSTFGIEFDGQVKPTPELTLTMAMTYLDPKYDKYVNSPFGDVSGQRVINISRLGATWGFQYDQPLANDDHFILRGDFHYEAPVQVEPGLLNYITRNPNGTVAGYQTGIDAARPFRREVSDMNASLTYAMANGLELTVWGRNLLDNRYLTGIFDSVAQNQSVSGYTSQPRTYGVAARFKW